MKTEQEILAHIGRINYGLTVPCDCKARGHEQSCVAGAIMMRSHIDLLKWVLDIPTPYDRLAKLITEEYQAEPPPTAHPPERPFKEVVITHACGGRLEPIAGTENALCLQCGRIAEGVRVKVLEPSREFMREVQP